MGESRGRGVDSREVACGGQSMDLPRSICEPVVAELVSRVLEETDGGRDKRDVSRASGTYDCFPETKSVNGGPLEGDEPSPARAAWSEWEKSETAVVNWEVVTHVLQENGDGNCCADVSRHEWGWRSFYLVGRRGCLATMRLQWDLAAWSGDVGFLV